MTHFEENSFTNDIVGELGIQGVGFGGPRAWGAPYFNVQGYSGFGDTFQATPMQSWDTVLEGRDAIVMATRTPQLQIWRWLSPVHLANVGLCPEPRLLSIHERIHHPDRDSRRHGICLGQL